MRISLAGIVGIDPAIAKVLRTQGITTVKGMYDATRTAEDRKRLAKATGYSLENITYWAIQAELLRIDGMTAEMAVELIQAGICSVEQFQAFNSQGIVGKLRGRKQESQLTREKLEELQSVKPRPAIAFETQSLSSDYFHAAETQAQSQKSAAKEQSAYSDLSAVIAELGKGIAKAQYELDTHAMELQKEILQNDSLYATGLNATWYVMPEVDFELKMDYSFVEEHTDTTEMKNNRRVKVMPMNATFQNTFRTEKTEQSTLKLRFVPVPPAERFTMRIFMPACVGMTVEEAVAALETEGITVYQLVNEKEEALNLTDVLTMTVKKQSITAGTLVLMDDVPKLTVG
ncbi:MAG: DUF4332 domain-containing protein [Lachnospiraceae bacterium]|nr:DUF4332 domain-containing protein [Lachnospiraceae bacterium]